ncbi:MAG: DUF1302 domain-containing protein [Opitutaceae bacterium]|nr:DUF1302 domain-containing protein [Opitutaceae bacterium]
MSYRNQPTRLRKPALAVCLSLLLSAMPAHLPGYSFGSGEVKGSFDTTVSVGALYRLDDADPALIGRTNGGTQNSVNTDDGNLNYEKGWASHLLKVSHDFQVSRQNLGLFVRGYYFVDLIADETKRTALSQQAKDRVDRGRELLDLYASGYFDIGDMPVDVRIGRQVLSLGESTFIPNGINVVNPVDLSKLRVPGAELKEAFLPVNMLKVSLGVTPKLTLEPFWLLEFRRNELEPAGTYFSTNDFASRGGSTVWLGFGGIPDRTGVSGTGGLGGIPRDRDREGNNFSQFGVAARYLADSGTEYGFYLARYHSRSPVISARTPAGPISAALVQATATNLANAQLVPAMAGAGIPPATIAAVLPQLLGAALTNVPAGSLPPGLVPFAPFYPGAVAIAAGARQIGLLSAAQTGRYFIEYPEDIGMLGVSFNTDLGATGISWQGEVSYKNDVPLQVDDVELLFAALSSLAPQFGASNQIGNFLGQYGREIPGYRRHDVWTAQTTMTKVFGPRLGASQLVLVGEIGGVWANLPSKDTLRYDGPGTFTSGSAANMVTSGNGNLPATPSNRFADSFSWGYQIAARLDYNNAFAGVNMSPSIAFVHDAGGTTPLPLGNFIAGRKSITLATEFTFQNAWALEVRYVNFFGAERYNLLSDRDFVSTALRYSF